MPMKLRKKTIVVVAGTFTVLIVLLYLFSQLLLLRNFETLEERDVSRNLHTAMSSLERLVEGIDTITNDWAAWDDTYAFMDDRNQAYIESNLVGETFASAKLNLIAYYDVSGKLHYARAFDYHNEEFVDLSGLFLNEAFSKDKILDHRDTESGHTGILMLREGPFLFSSSPVITSNAEGPIRGTLIMGRFLDVTEVDRISEDTLLPVKILPYSSEVLEIAGVNAAHFEKDGLAVRSLTETSILGLGLIRDVYGKPALVVRIELERETYAMGKTGIYYFILYLLISGIILGLVLILLIDRTVLSRITHLGKSLYEVGNSGDLSVQITTEGNDEISALAGQVNKMLRSLEEFEVDRKRAEEALAKSETKHRTLFESSTDAIMLLDKKGFFECNEATLQIFGCESRETLLDKHPSELSPPNQPNGLDSVTLGNELIATAYKEGKNQFEWIHRRKDGTEFPAEVLLTRMELDGMDVLQATVRDITKRKKMEEKLKKSATTDELTQAYNRRKFDEIIASEIKKIERYQQLLSIVILDIDNFKEVNDTYGHIVGDYVLRTLADAIRRENRETDYLVRWGGEEFVIVAPGTDLEGVKVLAERLRKAIECYKFETVGRITVSLGATQFRQGDTEDSLIARADDALYKAKATGKNRVVIGT